MSRYSLSHLSDETLIRDLVALVAQERRNTAVVVAHVAEMDVRRLYLPAGFPTMYSYCVHKLRFSEQAAFKRIRAARTARRVPAVFEALADGRLHLSAVILLAPHLTPENADELLAAATHKTKLEVEQLMAERFPRLDVPVLVEAIPGTPTGTTMPTDERIPPLPSPLSPGTVEKRGLVACRPTELGPPETPSARSRVEPLAPQRFALHLTIGQETHDYLRYAQALLSHQVPSEDVAAVLHHALKALVGQLERKRFAATRRPGRIQWRSKPGSRYIPATVKRAVWQRDGGQCTFVSESGRRCSARRFLEYDHIDPVALGGQATVERIRLRCRAHNQYEAERAFGTEFMQRKRQAAQCAAAEARARAEVQEHTKDVLAGLRELGVRADRARRAAEHSATLPNATLEERMRAALKVICPKPGRMAITMGP